MESGGIAVDQIVTVVDARRYPREVSVLGECFPGSTVTEIQYDSRASRSANIRNKGEVLAMVDFRNQAEPVLRVITEVGQRDIDLRAS